MDWTPEELQAIVDEHPLVLFMKGEPGAAQCGFSNRAAQVLQSLGEPFASVNILTDPCNTIRLRLVRLPDNASGLRSWRIDRWFRHCP